MNYVEEGYVRSGYIRLDSDIVSKFIFDSYGKFIFIKEGVTSLSINEMYSRWLDWIIISDNSRIKPAMRFSGYDPIPGGYTGVTFFLINGWRVVYDPRKVAISGVLFSEDYETPYVFLDYTPVYPAQVSSIVNTGPGANASDIASAVRAELTSELIHLTSLQNGLTDTQATMLLEIYKLYGLDPTTPLVVTNTSRAAGDDINQTIVSSNNTTTITRTN